MQVERMARTSGSACLAQREPLLLAFAGVFAAALAGNAMAQPAWPAKPLRIVVPFAAGGSNDVFARAVADRLPAVLGQPVIVENRAGAGSATGTAYAVRSAPDGHTLLAVSSTLTTLA
ncbi:MAG: Bug family tripartite tricarboxylate transporter substrate binding protein, partial [bacterium]